MFGRRKKIFRDVFGKENFTILGGFTRKNQENRLKKFTNTVILLGLAGYEPTASLVIYISSYPARPRRITVKYYSNVFDKQKYHDPNAGKKCRVYSRSWDKQ